MVKFKIAFSTPPPPKPITHLVFNHINLFVNILSWLKICRHGG